MKVRKKPVIVDAVPFYKDLWETKQDKYPMVSLWALTELVTPYPYIDTLEGPMKVSDGDYIIKGVNGEYYPCKPDIFEKTYEVAVSPSLTDDQQVVLDWLKNASVESSPFFSVWRSVQMNNLFPKDGMSIKQQFQVLQAFAEWGMKNE